MKKIITLCILSSMLTLSHASSDDPNTNNPNSNANPNSSNTANNGNNGNNGNNNGPTNTTGGSVGNTTSSSTVGNTTSKSNATGGSVGDTSASSSSKATGGSIGNVTSQSGNARATGGSVGDTNSASSSTSQAASSSNQQTVNVTNPNDITQRIIYSGSQTIKNVPSISGIPLTSSNDTCMGSTSGSVSAPGIGLGFGTTWVDENCKRLKNSRELWNMGMKAAALAVLCKDPEIHAALEVTGHQCPVTSK